MKKRTNSSAETPNDDGSVNQSDIGSVTLSGSVGDDGGASGEKTEAAVDSHISINQHQTNHNADISQNKDDATPTPAISSQPSTDFC